MLSKSETTKEIFSALCKAQGAVKSAPKDSTNPHLGKKYADLSSVWEACREAITGNGLSIIQMPETRDNGEVGMSCLITHTSGEWLQTPAVFTKPTKTDPQGLGAALTYLRRYTLSSVIGVVADEDDDAASVSQPRQQTQRQAQSQAARPAQPPQGTNDNAATDSQIKAINTICHQQGLEPHAAASKALNKEIPSLKQLSKQEASKVIDSIQVKGGAA